MGSGEEEGRLKSKRKRKWQCRSEAKAQKNITNNTKEEAQKRALAAAKQRAAIELGAIEGAVPKEELSRAKEIAEGLQQVVGEPAGAQ